MSQFFNERSGLIICGMITVGCLQSLIALEKIQSNPIVMGGRAGGRGGGHFEILLLFYLERDLAFQIINIQWFHSNSYI